MLYSDSEVCHSYLTAEVIWQIPDAGEKPIHHFWAAFDGLYFYKRTACAPEDKK